MVEGQKATSAQGTLLSARSTHKAMQARISRRKQLFELKHACTAYVKSRSDSQLAEDMASITRRVLRACLPETVASIEDTLRHSLFAITRKELEQRALSDMRAFLAEAYTSDRPAFEELRRHIQIRNAQPNHQIKNTA